MLEVYSKYVKSVLAQQRDKILKFNTEKVKIKEKDEKTFVYLDTIVGKRSKISQEILIHNKKQHGFEAFV